MNERDWKEEQRDVLTRPFSAARTPSADGGEDKVRHSKVGHSLPCTAVGGRLQPHDD